MLSSDHLLPSFYNYYFLSFGINIEGNIFFSEKIWIDLPKKQKYLKFIKIIILKRLGSRNAIVGFQQEGVEMDYLKEFG
jgi:hypothetical protein